MRKTENKVVHGGQADVFAHVFSVWGSEVPAPGDYAKHARNNRPGHQLL